jgi:hypothetical protein
LAVIEGFNPARGGTGFRGSRERLKKYKELKA